MELLLIIALFVIVAWGFWYLGTPGFKGAVGERRVNSALQNNLPDDYHVFSDLTLPVRGGTTQIDHIIVSRVGVFVIETKNMQGWIFGDEDQARWTQTIYRRKTRFQNPLRQNYKHVKAVQQALGINQRCIHNLVVFVGSATPRTYMPANVCWNVNELVDIIRSVRQVIFYEDEIASFTEKLSGGNFQTNRESRRAHIEHVTQAIDACPRCGSELVLRTNSKTKSEFLGCVRFPKCRGVREFS